MQGWDQRFSLFWQSNNDNEKSFFEQQQQQQSDGEPIDHDEALAQAIQVPTL